MAWLTEHWRYVLLLILVIALMPLRGGMGGGLMGMRRDKPSGGAEGARIDPVSGEPVAGDGAAVASYRGRLYYFNSRENRDRFEATPARFVPSGEEGHQHGHGGHESC